MSNGGARSDAWLDPLRFQNVCFDTMIVRHLVHAGGGDALVAGFGGRMYWPEAVQMELHLQSGAIPVLAAFLRSTPATVLELTEDEDDEAGDIRNDLYTRRTTKRDEFTNLGEAQCVVICRRKDEPYHLVCHDGRARDWARKHGLKPWTMIDVLYVFIRTGINMPGQAWSLYEKAVNETAMYELPAFPVSSGRSTFLRQAELLRLLFLAEVRVAPVDPSPDEGLPPEPGEPIA